MEGPVLRYYYYRGIFLRLGNLVVEGPVLRDYYNIFSPIRFTSSVVEGPVLKGYYNVEIVHNFTRFVVESPLLKGYYNTGNGSKFEGTIPVYFFLATPIISFYLCSVNHRNHPGV